MRQWRAAEMDPTQDSGDRTLALLKLSPSLSFVALRQDEVIGCVLGSYNGFSGSIFRLVVAPESQGAGIGTQLVRQAERALAALGATRCVLVCEQPLVEFYKALGYEQTDLCFLARKL